MKNFLYVFFGAGIGGVLRHFFVTVINKTSTNFLIGTLSVNLIGCFLIGLFLCSAQKNGYSQHTLLFLGIGLLGGFTTFSAFSAETILYLQKSQFLFALCNVLLSISGIFTAYLGYLVARYW